MNEISIEIENLSKVYKLYENSNERFKEALSPFKKNYHKEFHALNNISFNLKKGETLGIIGKNGAGKSTLLKIITGVLSPSSGYVYVNGKISALLELGAGFNPEFTGIENIYLNGTMMGYSKKEMDERVESIVNFADIDDYIFQPVKSYSSGMFARLAFSVAVSVEPEILIVDEALSVGDMQFQEKSFTKMKQIRNNGTSIIFVSHSIHAVRNFCDTAIWMHKGEIKEKGIAELVCEKYEEYIKTETKVFKTSEIISKRDNSKNKSIEINSISLNSKLFSTDEDIIINIGLSFNKKISDYGVGILIYDEYGKIITVFNTVRDDIILDACYTNFNLVIPHNDFMPGKYYISVSVSDHNIMFSYDRYDYCEWFEIKAKRNKNGIPISEGVFRCKHKWKF